MKLRRFSQLGWHGCMDLVAAAAGHHVVRVELGEAPKMPEAVVEWEIDGMRVPCVESSNDGAFVEVPGALLRVVPEWAEETEEKDRRLTGARLPRHVDLDGPVASRRIADLAEHMRKRYPQDGQNMHRALQHAAALEETRRVGFTEDEVRSLNAYLARVIRPEEPQPCSQRAYADFPHEFDHRGVCRFCSRPEKP